MTQNFSWTLEIYSALFCTNVVLSINTEYFKNLMWKWNWDKFVVVQKQLEIHTMFCFFFSKMHIVHELFEVLLHFLERRRGVKYCNTQHSFCKKLHLPLDFLLPISTFLPECLIIFTFVCTCMAFLCHSPPFTTSPILPSSSNDLN